MLLGLCDKRIQAFLYSSLKEIIIQHYHKNFSSIVKKILEHKTDKIIPKSNDNTSMKEVEKRTMRGFN